MIARHRFSHQSLSLPIMKNRVHYGIITLLLTSSLYATNTSGQPTKEQDPTTTVSHFDKEETIVFHLGPSKGLKIALRCCSLAFVGAIFFSGHIWHKEKEKVPLLIGIMGLLWWGSLATLCLAFSFYDPTIKCTPQGLILPTKCDIHNFNILEVLSFKARYLPLIPYDNIARIDPVMLEHPINRPMFQLKTTQGRYYYINPLNTSSEDMKKLCNLLLKHNKDIKIDIGE